MIACINKMLNPPRTDWSEIDRLEQRIRDLRQRIRKAKSTQERLFPVQGTHNKKPFNLWPEQSDDTCTCTSASGYQIFLPRTLRANKGK